MADRVGAAVAKFPGTVYLFAKNLDTGEEFAIRADDRIRTASTIKVPIMTAVFAAVESGDAKWSDELVLKDADKVGGSGVLQEMSDGLRLPLRDLVRLMIVVSDNTATNLLLERFFPDFVNDQMQKLGLVQTRSLRKILGSSKDVPVSAHYSSKEGRLPGNQEFGIGVTTAREMVALLAKIERGEVISPAASKEMIAVMKRQQYKEGIGRRLGAIPVASKSGALDHLRSDVGIVYSRGGRIAIAATCDGIPAVDYSPDNPGNLFISELTGFLLDGLGK
jgi:beta-lactamase class A